MISFVICNHCFEPGCEALISLSLTWLQITAYCHFDDTNGTDSLTGNTVHNIVDWGAPLTIMEYWYDDGFCNTKMCSEDNANEVGGKLLIPYNFVLWICTVLGNSVKRWGMSERK
jgi:hypothetical protein